MRRLTFFLPTIIIALLFTPVTGQAQSTWTVCAVGCDFATIQAAVDGASAGDTLDIFAETFVENVVIDKDLTLQGTSPILTVVDGNSTGRVFTIEDGINTIFSSMTITNGRGGIANSSGALTVNDSTLSNNSTDFGDNGGGIKNVSGIVTVNNSVFSGNFGSFGGGGIFNSIGSVTVTNTSFTNNGAEDTGGAIDNGGISDPGGTLTVINSTFSDNSAFLGGGLSLSDSSGATIVSKSLFISNGAFFGGAVNIGGGTISISNSTFSGNAAGFGGGIRDGSGTAVVSNSTFNGNSASFGAGIYVATGTITMTNTIIANSLDSSDCSGSISGSHNLTDDETCGSLANPVTSFDPNLADNGGPTLTHALLPGSNAIDAGDNVICDAPPVNGVDQRGFPRSDGACDIGAFEFGAEPPVPTASCTLEPASAVGAVGTEHTVTAVVTLDANPAPDTAVTFAVAAGPNDGDGDTGTTNAAGAASFTYLGDGGPGEDTIQAVGLIDGQFHFSCTAVMDWEEPTAVELLSFTATADAAGQVDVAWVTAWELDNAGFNVYRSDRYGGVLTQLNSALIASEGTTSAGANYSLLDTPGDGTWYYTLEDVDLNGVATKHGPAVVTVSVPTAVTLHDINSRADDSARWLAALAILGLLTGLAWRSRGRVGIKSE